MKYLSEYGDKVFNTEQECLEYENEKKRQLELTEQRKRERQKDLDAINEKHHELEKLISAFDEKYGTKEPIYIPPFYYLLRALCG